MNLYFSFGFHNTSIVDEERKFQTYKFYPFIKTGLFYFGPNGFYFETKFYP